MPILGTRKSRHSARLALKRDMRGLLLRALHQSKLRRTDLAKRLGVSPARVTDILAKNANLTLETISDVLWACDDSLGVYLEEFHYKFWSRGDVYRGLARKVEG